MSEKKPLKTFNVPFAFLVLVFRDIKKVRKKTFDEVGPTGRPEMQLCMHAYVARSKATYSYAQAG